MDIGSITGLFGRGVQTPGGGGSGVKSIEIHAQRILKWLRGLPLSVWQRLVALLLIIALCHSLAQLFWLLVGFGGEPAAADINRPAPVNSQLAERASVASASIDVERLKTLDLFGAAAVVDTAPSQQAVATGIEREAVDTRLNLTLNGVIGSSDPKAARAIISDDKSQALYAPGESLPVGNNARLVKVLEERVILENGGRYESLWLYSDEPLPAPSRRSSTRTVQKAADKRDQKTPTVSRSQAESLDSVIKFSIARKGGDVIGFRIRPGSNRELFKELGLKTNDIVTSVNGIALDSSAKAMEVYETLRGATSASLGILRNNEPVSITVAVDEG